MKRKIFFIIMLALLQIPLKVSAGIVVPYTKPVIAPRVRENIDLNPIIEKVLQKIRNLEKQLKQMTDAKHLDRQNDIENAKKFLTEITIFVKNTKARQAEYTDKVMSDAASVQSSLDAINAQAANVAQSTTVLLSNLK